MVTEAQRAAVIKELEAALAAMTPEEQVEEVFHDGENPWTPRQILEAVKGRTPFGEGVLESHFRMQRSDTSGT